MGGGKYCFKLREGRTNQGRDNYLRKKRIAAIIFVHTFVLMAAGLYLVIGYSVPNFP